MARPRGRSSMLPSALGVTVDLRSLAQYVDRHLTMSKSSEAEPLPGLFLLRHTAPTDFEATVYDPIVCLILQGEKTTSAPDRTVTISAGQCVVVSHDLPVVARVTKASHDTPYLALVVRLDLGVLRSLHAGASEGGAPIEDARVLEARPVDEKVARVINATSSSSTIPMVHASSAPLSSKSCTTDCSIATPGLCSVACCIAGARRARSSRPCGCFANPFARSSRWPASLASLG